MNSLPDWRAAPRYSTLNLRAGFQPDPREVQVDAGGSREARAIRPDCAGWIDFARPDVDLNYEPGQYPLFIGATSAADTTIVINDPAGNWHCNDDLVGLDPGVVFQRPLRGNYNIWVGTLDRGRPQRATVRVSEAPPPRAGAPGAAAPGRSGQAQAPAAGNVRPPQRSPLQPLPAGDALLAYTRQALGPALAASVPLVTTATPRVLRAETREPNLPALVIAWAEEAPPVEATAIVAAFESGVNGQCRDRRAVADAAHPSGARFSAYTANCAGAGLQLWMIVGRDAERTQLLALAAPNAEALRARGRLLLQHLGIAEAAPQTQAAIPAPRPPVPAPYQEPPNYAQLRLDCADDRDAPRQIAGCDAVLANPAETASYGVATSNRGHARERSGDLAAALADYERAIAQDPTYTTAQISRARVLAGLGRPDEAIAALDRIIAARDGGWARFERSQILASRNERERAIADLNEAARLLSDDAEVRQARDWAQVRLAHGLDFAELAAPATTLAEAVLAAEGFSGVLSGEDAARIRRDGPNRVVLDWPTMPQTGDPGRVEVEARSCSEILYTEIAAAPGAQEQAYDRRVIDLHRLRGLLSRSGAEVVHAAGAYGERTRDVPGGPIRSPIETSPGSPGQATYEYAQAVVYLDAIQRFCPAGAAATPVAQAQPAVAPSTAPNPLEAAVGAVARPYVGQALLRAPLGPLPAGDALLAYTRDLLSPMLGAGASVTPFGASGTAYKAQGSGLPELTLRWYDGAAPDTARTMMNGFERDLNAGCDNRPIAQRGGTGARVAAYAASCPRMDPPYQLWWLEAADTERSRVLLVAVPSTGGPALLAGGQRVLDALGMSAAAPQASVANAPASAANAARRPAPAPTREVTTVRGLMRDKPFSASFPASLAQRNEGNADLTVADASREIELTMNIRPSTPSQSADFAARVFGDGVGWLQMLRRSVPGAGLVGNAVLRLPAGPAHVVHWTAPAQGSDPAMHYVDASLFDGGREYWLTFAVRDAAFARHRETIGFILANFAPSSAPRQCCADPVALP